MKKSDAEVSKVKELPQQQMAASGPDLSRRPLQTTATGKKFYKNGKRLIAEKIEDYEADFVWFRRRLLRKA